MLVKSDLTSKDTSLWLSGICTVLIASMKLSVDCSLCWESSVTVRRALPWPPNKHFLQVSQSEYANLIDGHASLQSSQSTKPNRFSRSIVNKMSEVYTWLKSLPGGLGLEKCSRVFESRGFLTLSSLKYLRPGDIDAFLPSPEKNCCWQKNASWKAKSRGLSTRKAGEHR